MNQPDKNFTVKRLNHVLARLSACLPVCVVALRMCSNYTGDNPVLP